MGDSESQQVHISQQLINSKLTISFQVYANLKGG